MTPLYSSTPTSEVTDASEAPSAIAKQSKDDFTKLVLGKTRRQIRTLLGSPDSVWGTYTGFIFIFPYFHLPVYDEDAGTEVGTADITFGGQVTTALAAYQLQCTDQDPLADDCANDVEFN